MFIYGLPGTGAGARDDISRLTWVGGAFGTPLVQCGPTSSSMGFRGPSSPGQDPRTQNQHFQQDSQAIRGHVNSEKPEESEAVALDVQVTPNTQQIQRSSPTGIKGSLSN